MSDRKNKSFHTLGLMGPIVSAFAQRRDETMKLTDFERGYVECALWSSTDESDETGGEPLDKNYGISDIADETLDTMVADCKRFQADNEMLLRHITDGKYGMSHAGHDFWLTRNGHGAGYWDGEVAEPYATELTDAANAFGKVDLYVGDDGRVYA